MERLVAEARKHPGGWVYALDGRYDPDGAVPPWAVMGAYQVDEHGEVFGDFIPNPNYDPNREVVTDWKHPSDG